MDDQSVLEGITEQLPPPLPPPAADEIPSIHTPQPYLHARLYRIWCLVTLSAAVFTLVLIGSQTVTRLVDNNGDLLREILLNRILGAEGGAEEESLIELMLGQVLFPLGRHEVAVGATPNNTPNTPPKETALPPETGMFNPFEEPKDIYAYDPSSVPEGEHPILPLDLSLIEYGPDYISNETAYTPDIAALRRAENILPHFDHTNSAVYPPGQPVVLILHTHATEAYSPAGATSYTIDTDYARSKNPTENVVAVGARMAEVLRENGVPTLHCTILHDEQAYRDSYVRAAETIRTYLAKYPSIQYVFDVHRDALVRGENELLRPVTLVNGKETAQVMVLAGSDYNGAVFPDWQTNLAFALQLRDALNSRYTRLARPVYLRSSAFNEHYATRSLLLEIGASGNNLDEAIRAGELVAAVLAEMIQGKLTP
ncbi:MAG: stage II sporulation protein P [Clostridia bacterium]|nr:stage II sporulation protein P [Clostridia bacterium]